MTPDEIKKRFPNAGPGFIAINSTPASVAMGGLAAEQHQPKARPALEQDLPRRPSGKGSLGIVVSIIAVRNRFQDADNSRAGYKPLQDAIAATLAVDDGSEAIRFEYSQHVSAGSEGTIVNIEWVRFR